MSKYTLAPPPTLFKNDAYTMNWVNQLIKRVSGDAQIDWSQIDLTESDHDELMGRHEADATDSDTESNKHVSNNDLKLAQDHRSASSAHSVTGDIIGSGDYATALKGGSVLLAAAVSDSVASTVSIVSADAGGTYTSAERDLINELKTDVNTLTTDLNLAITQLNALLAALRTAKQVST